MPDRQRIVVVSTTTADADLARLRRELRGRPTALTTPTAEGARVVRAFDVEPQPEVLLAPASHPDADRGHRLDELVRHHAVRDRFTDVLVVTDPATATLLLRVLAPDQLSTAGGVTVVGLARGERPVAVRRALVAGVVVGVLEAAVEPLTVTLALPGALVAIGLALLLVPRWRHAGRGLLLAAAVSVVVVVAVVAGADRFPGAW